jgi:hypothetical protein
MAKDGWISKYVVEIVRQAAPYLRESGGNLSSDALSEVDVKRIQHLVDRMDQVI